MLEMQLLPSWLGWLQKPRYLPCSFIFADNSVSICFQLDQSTTKEKGKKKKRQKKRFSTLPLASGLKASFDSCIRSFEMGNGARKMLVYWFQET